MDPLEWRSEWTGANLRVRDVIDRLLQERSVALDTRDPLAIRRAGDRYKTIVDALDGLDPAAEIDPDTFTLSLRQAAKISGRTLREFRAMAYQNKMPTRRVGGELRVPLSAVL
ncbi:MAG: hypothetical protein M0Z94_08815 [Dehalococcoidales bacterium]|nr:hypothetical protein [Dehalococcoidales bacterium]